MPVLVLFLRRVLSSGGGVTNPTSTPAVEILTRDGSTIRTRDGATVVARG
jgi:hypothetical protein